MSINNPYRETPVISKYIEYLDIWVPVEIPSSVNDTEIVIEPQYHLRPDKLAKDMYGDEKLWWIFSIRNKDTIIDTFSDFISGAVIFVPQPEDIRRYLS